MENIGEHDIGVVQKILDKNKAIVLITTRGECTTCINKNGCNIFASKDKSLIEVAYTDELKEGDNVIIVIEPTKKIISSLLIFFLPLIALFIFYLIGLKLLKNELLGSIFSLVGVIFSYYIIFLLIKKNKNLNNYLPKAIKLRDKKEFETST